MKQLMVWLTVLVLMGACTRHERDGLYIANIRFTGVTKTWIVEGNTLTLYSLGLTKVVKCRQYSDRIEIGDEIYYFDDKGDIVMPEGKVAGMDYRLVRISGNTKYTFAELDKLVDEAYENEKKARLGIK